MTKIAGIPAELQTLAGALVESAPELELAASFLSSAGSSLPAMPGGVADQVEASILQAARLVGAAAATAASEGADLKRRGLWLQIADQWEARSVAVGLFTAPLDGFNAVQRLRAYQLWRTWNAYEQAVSPVVAAEGESSLAALNAQLGFEEDNPMAPGRFATVLEGAGDESRYIDSLGSLADVADTVGKVTPVLGVAGGIIGFVRPLHEHGALMYADRGASVGTALGSSALLAEAAGMTLVPGVGEAALVVVAVAGAWELYENRKEVARLTVSGGKFLLEHAYLAAPEGILAKAAWDDRRQLVHGLVSTAATGENLAEDGAKGILHGVEHLGGLHFP